MPGHLFVVEGDARKIASAAWLLPCDVAGTVSPGWFDREQELRARVDDFRAEAVAAFAGDSRVARVPGDGRPQVWMVDTGGFAGTPDDWYVDGIRAFVGAATRECGDTRPRLLAVPFVGAGLGGKAFDKGGLLPRLVATLADETQRLDVDIAFVTRDRRAFAAGQAYRRRDPGRFWRRCPTTSRKSPIASPSAR